MSSWNWLPTASLGGPAPCRLPPLVMIPFMSRSLCRRCDTSKSHDLRGAQSPRVWAQRRPPGQGRETRGVVGFWGVSALVVDPLTDTAVVQAVEDSARQAVVQVRTGFAAADHDGLGRFAGLLARERCDERGLSCRQPDRDGLQVLGLVEVDADDPHAATPAHGMNCRTKSVV